MFEKARELLEEEINNDNENYEWIDGYVDDFKALLKHIDNINEVYDRYKHLDGNLSDQRWLEKDNFVGNILYDLWQAIKPKE